MTTLADPVPGGRPGDVERATALSGELAGRGVHGVVPAYVDTAGIGRVKTVPTPQAAAAAAAWGVGMSPVFDTFLANDSIVTTDALQIARWAGRANTLRVYRLQTDGPEDD